MPDLPSLAEAAEALCLAALLVLPGLGPAHLLGLRGIAAWGLAPAVSVTLVAVGGIVAPVVGLRWNVLVLLGATLLAGAVAVLAARLLARAGPGRRPGPGPEPASARVGALVGCAAGAVSLATTMAVSMRS